MNLLHPLTSAKERREAIKDALKVYHPKTYRSLKKAKKLAHDQEQEMMAAHDEGRSEVIDEVGNPSNYPNPIEFAREMNMRNERLEEEILATFLGP